MLLLGTPGLGEWAIILLLALLFFGKNKLPELARGIGSGIHEFRKGINGQFDKEEENESEPEQPQPKKVARTSSSGSAQKTAKKSTKSSKSKI